MNLPQVLRSVKVRFFFVVESYNSGTIQSHTVKKKNTMIKSSSHPCPEVMTKVWKLCYGVYTMMSTEERKRKTPQKYRFLTVMVLP